MADQKYIVENPRGIDKRYPVLTLGSGRQVHAGDTVLGSELSDIAEQAYEERGFIRKAKRGEG